MRHVAVAVLAATLALAGCGGGGSSAGSPIQPQPIVSVAPALTGPLSNGTVVIVIGQPASNASSSSSRKTQFVSPSAYSVGIAINGGTPTYSSVYDGSQNCVTSGSTRTCTIAVAAPVGSDTLALSFYSGPNGTGSLLGTGSGTVTASQLTPFSVTITISPVVAAASSPVVTYTTGTQFVAGTAGTATVSFIYSDAASNTIPTSTPSFANTLTLSSSDPHVTISPASFSAPPSTITLTYDGSSSVAFPVTITLASGTTTLRTFQVTHVAMVSTFAGTGAIGFTNGPASSATFYYPYGVAVDSAGNVYVSDPSNYAIREISATGTVSTYAGTGASGFTNGPAASATFDGPTRLAFDSSNNLYVDDQNNNAVRKIAPAGIVSTYAGTGAYGFANGPAASATFEYPDGVAVDTNGNVFVSDANNAVREITPMGIVSTYAGTGASGFTNGPAASATFDDPISVAVDGSGNVFVSDTLNNAIRKISAAGVVSTYAGTGAVGFANGPAASATFHEPGGIAVDRTGNVYVADYDNNAIRIITPAGMVSTFAGTGAAGFTNGPAASATFNHPVGIAVDSNGNFYVTDGNNVIRKITP